MKIRLRLLASLRKHLPPEGIHLADDTVEWALPEGTSVAAAIARLGMGKGEWALVMLDGVHQRPDTLGQALKDAQSLTIAPPIAGG